MMDHPSICTQLWEWLTMFVIVFFFFVLTQSDQLTLEEFSRWIQYFPEVTTLTTWLLVVSNGCPVPLSDNSETPTFYQTLAGATHCKYFQSILCVKVCPVISLIVTALSHNVLMREQCHSLWAKMWWEDFLLEFEDLGLFWSVDGGCCCHGNLVLCNVKFSLYV